MSASVLKSSQVKYVNVPFVVTPQPHAPAPHPHSEGHAESHTLPATTDAEQHLSESVLQEAQAILDTARIEAEVARAEASRLLENAQREAAEIRRTAQTQGFEAGRAEGRIAGDGEARVLIATAQRVLDDSTEWWESMLKMSEPQIIKMVGDIAVKLFGEGFIVPPDQLRSVVARALDHASTLGEAAVYLHPDDLAALKPFWTSSVPLAPDDTLRRGGCVVKAARGMVDGRIEVQLEKIGQTLADEAVLSQMQEAA
ncbi:MAG: hypothetical protein FJ030_06675 [Chloroflexi bacterium]|nr:hypothetical protein [Chloroflexota bacterium]